MRAKTVPQKELMARLTFSFCREKDDMYKKTIHFKSIYVAISLLLNVPSFGVHHIQAFVQCIYLNETFLLFLHIF